MFGARFTSTATTIVFAACTACTAAGDDTGDDVGDDDDVPTECSESNDTCSGDSICIAGSCESAFGRIYDVTNIDVSLPTTDSAGEAWDVGGGAPDIFVEISVNGTIEATTTTVQDQFSAFFAGAYQVQPVGGGELVLQAYDEDLTANDPAIACVADPLTAALLRSRLLACSASGASMEFRIEPR